MKFFIKRALFFAIFICVSLLQAMEPAQYVISGSDVDIFVWDSTSAQLVKQFPIIGLEKPTVRTLGYFFHGDSYKILASSFSNSFHVYTIDGTVWQKFTVHDALVNCLAVVKNNNSTQIICGQQNNKISVWDMDSGDHVRTFQTESSVPGTLGITCLSLYQDQDITYLVAGSCDNSVYIYNFNTGDMVAHLTGFSNWVTCVGIFKNENGFNLVAGSLDTTIRCWNIASQAELWTVNYQQYYAGGATSFQDGQIKGLILFKKNETEVLCAALANDNNINLFDAQTGSNVGTLTGHTNWVLDLRFYQGSDGSQKLVSCSTDKTVRLWDLASHELETTFYGHTDVVRTLSLFYRQGSVYCASASNDDTVIIQDLNKKLDCKRSIKSETWMVSVASDDQIFSNKSLFAVSHDSIEGCHIPTWNSSNIEVIDVSSPESNNIEVIAVSPESKKQGLQSWCVWQ